MTGQNEVVVQSGGGVSMLGLLFVLFTALKLTGVIAWSWWWVTAPLWGPIAFILCILLFVLLISGLFMGGIKLAEWIKS